MGEVDVAALEAHLSRYLRLVRAGWSITVMDGRTAIARIVPLPDANADGPLRIRPASRRPSELELPPPLSTPTDSSAALFEDRAAR